MWGSTSVDEVEVAGGTQVPEGPVKGMLVGSAGACCMSAKGSNCVHEVRAGPNYGVHECP